ncbi:MAG: carboxypeptidase-like regulatory domain-containing protein [Bacteroidales bacterium]|nr:carboxypeptidase-like regulatory domain-containing protein [Bacteroidales bacterium]
MNVLKAFVVFILVCITFQMVAQQTLITGKVQDRYNFTSISNANISLVGTKAGCATDLKGEFTIIADTLPVFLIISHIGYETQRIWLENTSGALNILMKPISKMLQEVEIKSKSEPVPFFKDEHYAVLDYEVDNTLVYLLIFRYRIAKSQLICMADNGDTIAFSRQLGFRPTGLYADCLGYLHVLSEDSSYQVYLDKDTIVFPYKTEIHMFLATMSDCIASAPDWLYFRKESIDHQVVNFYRIHRKSKEKQYIASIADEENMKMLRHNPHDYYLLVMDTLPASSAEIIEWIWVNKILYKANASALKKIGDSLVVFNTADGTLHYYSMDGKFLSIICMPVLNKHGEKWTREIFFDEMAHLPHTTFMKNGRIHLYGINIKTGELHHELFSSHLFPQKIKIHNHYLYYLYDIPGIGDNKHLFRQKI